PHKSDGLAELVCSNSLRSDNPENAIGLLHEELRRLGSAVLEEADRARVPAGDALAVDRVAFSEALTRRIAHHPSIEVRGEEATDLPGELCIVATGPLTGDALARSLAEAVGDSALAFYDAIAPIGAGHSTAPAAARGGATPPRGPRGHGLAPGGVPDAAHLAGAEAHLLGVHPGAARGYVPPPRAGAPEHLPRCASRACAGRQPARAPGRVLRRADHRRRGIRGERRVRPHRGAPRARPGTRRAVRAAAGHHSAGRFAAARDR